MPKFGLKCFLGSFIFSLVAVFAATKGYLALSENVEETELSYNNIEAKNIELFSPNTENDEVYEKYNQIANNDTSPKEEKIADTNNVIEKAKAEDSIIVSENYDDISDTLDNSVNSVSDISSVANNDLLYSPDEEENSQDLAVNEIKNIENPQISADLSSIAETKDDNELVIADASLAPEFIIPLKHNFSTSNSAVSVSSQTNSNQVAMASQNVNVKNLGTNNRAAITTEAEQNNVQNAEAQDITGAYSSPWDEVSVANKHITKNKIEQFASEHKQEVVALDKNSNSPASADNETQLAYRKMPRNLIIPIPEDIMNDENLTPQLSYSEENKKIEQKLHEKEIREGIRQPEPVVAPAPTIVQTQSDNAITPKEENLSLTDSIASWFSSSNNENSNTDNNNKPAEDNGSKKVNTGSTFSKLLGLDGKKNENKIVPTELKLAFQPNRAEISGQTLEWLHAFSENAINNEDVMVEIRIDDSTSFELQQKRLNLLYTILANNGVDYNKINVIFTAREPNSFIIRNVKYATEQKPVPTAPKADNPW